MSRSKGGARRFEGLIESGRGGGAFVLVPFDVKEAFGSGRPKVRALIDGYEYRGSIANMGQGHCLGIRKDVRAAIGKDVGDTVQVQVELDTSPRTVEMPPELLSALEKAPDARERYDGMSYTHRKEYAQWVSEAKKQETRDRRATKAVEMIREGRSRG
ncbi:MAG: YdeI/OmpD-associated family protein [Longimicrobiales bacterium]|nr:YdeI/OmpD-associated family protein [Longimicrobiales bacterium]